MKERALFSRHQPFVRATESQLNPKGRGEEDIDFPRLDLLKVARGYLGAFGQSILRQTLAHPLPAHIGAEGPDTPPFLSGNCHSILERCPRPEMNDTYIVK